MVNRRNLPGPSPVRRDRLLREHVHDTYKMRGKLPEPTRCPDCGAVYRKGRWQWAEAVDGAHAELCPACHRIRDRYPGGYLTLAGEFFAAHRDEILNLARNTEQGEKALHPLRRIMAEQADGEAWLVTTTDMGLARSIGDAIHHAYKGELDYRYDDASSILRVHWRR